MIFGKCFSAQEPCDMRGMMLFPGETGYADYATILLPCYPCGLSSPIHSSMVMLVFLPPEATTWTTSCRPQATRASAASLPS